MLTRSKLQATERSDECDHDNERLESSPIHKTIRVIHTPGGIKGKVHVIWDAQKNADEYRVFVNKHSQGWRSETITKSPFYVLPGLFPNRLYQVSVEAARSRGVGHSKPDTVPDLSCTFLTMRHQIVECPEFCLAQTEDTSMAVRENGKVLVNIEGPVMYGNFYGAYAEMTFNDGRHYWELEVTVVRKLVQDKNHLVYSAGVAHVRKMKCWSLGWDTHSWAVEVTKSEPHSFGFLHNSKKTRERITILPEGGDIFESPSYTFRQGFYLDCHEKRLTILDCTHNRLLHIFCDLDLSEPLVPAISLHNFEWVDVSVRLLVGREIIDFPDSLISKELT